MTPNSNLQFINKESGNSMTTAKWQSARLLPHWRQSNDITIISLHFKTLDIILCYHSLEKRRLIGRVPMTLIQRQRLCAHTSYCL